ncbi:3-deoxy-8-phosphooctulonate synthase, partial [Francisella tularensis subsp. holarctica]|nr:3-deoxy-8-phosphooctulonate synthase [Francisella tularensis subsp. holarctica]
PHPTTPRKEQMLEGQRGVRIGYNNPDSEKRSLEIMKATGCPVVYDATQSVQLPGGQGSYSCGQREFVQDLSKAAMAVGIDGL